MRVSKHEQFAEMALGLKSASEIRGAAAGIILEASRFGAGTATRVLMRHFGIPFKGIGELRMAKVSVQCIRSLFNGGAYRFSQNAQIVRASD